MEKKTITNVIDYHIHWDEATISEIRKDLDELEKLGAVRLRIDVSYDSFTIEAISERLETDEEFNARIEAEEAYKLIQQKKEFELYKNLKAKYEQ